MCTKSDFCATTDSRFPRKWKGYEMFPRKLPRKFLGSNNVLKSSRWNKGYPAQENRMEEKLTLDELKPFLPAWYLELKKKIKEEKEKKSR